MVVKCGYEGSSRRVNFPSAATCRLDSVRLRVSTSGRETGTSLHK